MYWSLVRVDKTLQKSGNLASFSVWIYSNYLRSSKFSSYSNLIKLVYIYLWFVSWSLTETWLNTFWYFEGYADLCVISCLGLAFACWGQLVSSSVVLLRNLYGIWGVHHQIEWLEIILRPRSSKVLEACFSGCPLKSLRIWWVNYTLIWKQKTY